MTDQILTQERLKSIYHYDPITGLFTRIKNGFVAGTNAKTYIKAYVDGKYYFVHRLAFLYMTGSFPPVETDHINRNIQDNRWCNLRSVSVRDNQRNSKTRVDNKSGVKGVSFDKVSNKWNAQLKLNKNIILLGKHEKKSDAILARKNGEALYWQ